MIGLFRRLPWTYQIGLIVVVVTAIVVLGFLALQQFQAGSGGDDQPDETVDVGGAAQFVPQGEQPQGVHVIGRGEVVLAPDLAILAFAVEAEDPSGTTATERAREAVTAVQEALKELGGLSLTGQDLQTGNLSLYPVFSNKASAATPESYLAATTITVRLSDLSRVPDVLEAALTAGASELLELNYTLLEQRQAEQDALRLASVDAASKARAIADAIQGQVSGLINIEGDLTVLGPEIEKPNLEHARAAHPGQVRIRAVVRANFAFG